MKLFGGRAWTYTSWSGCLPFWKGTDEYFRRTLVLTFPVPFGPALVIAGPECRCAECEQMKAEDDRCGARFARWRRFHDAGYRFGS